MENFGQLEKRNDLLGPEKAPDSLAARYGLATLEGVKHLPGGMWHAVKEDINHPLQTLTLIAGSAALGAAVKYALPKMGPWGKAAGVAVGAYTLYQASEPVLDAYTIAGQATSRNDINVAGRLLGDVGGSLAVNLAISGASYKLGSYGASRFMTPPKIEVPVPGPGAPKPGPELPGSPKPGPEIPTPAPKDGGPIVKPNDGGPIVNPNDGGVNPRGGVWNATILPNLPGALGIGSASSTSMSFDARLAGVQKFNPSEQNRPDGVLLGPTDNATQFDVTVQLKSKASDAELEQTLNDIANGKRAKMSDAEFGDKFGATQQSLDELTKFAQAYGLKVKEADLRSGRVVLNGTAEQFSDAFKTQIDNYGVENGMKIRGREGALFVPKGVARNIEGVFGIDNRPQATPRIKDFTPKGVEGKSSTQLLPEQSFRADEIAAMYNFPKGTTGKGQGAAIIELGGGIDLKNEAEYYKQYGLKQPDIKILEVGEGKNQMGKNERADKEASLDSQVIGSVAPDAKQTIIFTGNSEQGYIDALGRAAFPKENEEVNHAISLSWGQPIGNWSRQGRRGIHLALQKAALKGISVFAASGDDGASDRVPNEKYQVDYPAADQYVTGTGGTKISVKDGKIVSEVVWHDSFGITGGGVSDDPVPDFQTQLKVVAQKITGRGVPDISAHASPANGYKIRFGGQDIVSGGTSAVAPLYAALALRLNEGLGGGEKTVGWMNPFLYKQALEGKAPYFNDVTEGNNDGFDAKVGWDPTTGWGSVDGQKLLDAYKKDRK